MKTKGKPHIDTDRWPVPEVVDLAEVLELVVDNEEVAVLRVKWPMTTPANRTKAALQFEMKLLSTGYLQGNEEWIAYYKKGSNTILTKHTDGKYWRFDRTNIVSNSVKRKRVAIVLLLTQLEALPVLAD